MLIQNICRCLELWNAICCCSWQIVDPQNSWNWHGCLFYTLVRVHRTILSHPEFYTHRKLPSHGSGETLLGFRVRARETQPLGEKSRNIQLFFIRIQFSILYLPKWPFIGSSRGCYPLHFSMASRVSFRFTHFEVVDPVEVVAMIPCLWDASAFVPAA